ncbi:hypothetical protein F4778DRAFT_775815 [Xylariomycetidae sp. FL2044]|nr:hypothetical protein F4778DRAFT_775815 [Xylariomycetidae sp. FL2044]
MSTFSGGIESNLDLLQARIISRTTLLGVLWFGAAFTLLTVAARLAIRLKILGQLKADDYLVIAAYSLYLSYAILWTVLSDNLYLALDSFGGIDLTRIMSILNSAASALHGTLASYVVLWTCLWLIKVSFMIFFYPMGRHMKSQRILWRGVLAFIVVSYFVCIGVLDYRCLASTGIRVISTCTRQDIIDFEYISARVTVTLDIVSDAAIVLVSGNVVWKVQLPLKKKLALAGICSLTVFMIVVEIVRITGPADQTWLLLWSGIEMMIAIVVACSASFRSLYTHTKHSRPSAHQASDKHLNPHGHHTSPPAGPKTDPYDTMTTFGATTAQSPGLERSESSNSSVFIWGNPEVPRPQKVELSPYGRGSDESPY